MRLNEFLASVYREYAREGQYLSVSLDLRPNADGRSTAESALRAAWSGLGDQLTTPDELFGEVIDNLRDSLAEEMRVGTEGLYLLASAEDTENPRVFTMETPLRNDLRVTARPWLIELERVAFLSRRPIVSAFANRDGVELMRVVLGEIDEESAVDHPTHGLRHTRGRTSAERFGGATAPFGGHSWNRVENSVEEHRAAAAREGAEAIGEMMQDGDQLVVAGPPEPRAELVNHLPDNLRAGMREQDGEFDRDQSQRYEWSTQLARDLQLEVGDELARDILSGAWGERIARGRNSIDTMFRNGRVSQLVMHEDAVTHWGVASDARQVAAPWDDSWYGEALWKARDTSAGVLFSRHPALLEEQEGVVATLRW